jgi:MOSC domain-containing protein YiiM
MKLISLNIGEERTLHRKDRSEQTGIFKIPTDKPVKVNKPGLEGDVIISTDSHGGLDQAIYIYGSADYAWWSKELGKAIGPGTFGDNLTISDLACADFNVGDYLHIGGVSLQVTAPRIPCATFATRMEDPEWVKKFRHAERPGLYCRVLKEGTISTGETVLVEKYAGETVSIVEMYRYSYEKDKSEESLRRYLRLPISNFAREGLEMKLQKLLHPAE